MVAIVGLGLTTGARAADASDALLREIRTAQREGAIEREVALCADATAFGPTDRVARLCTDRLELLEPRRDPDGTFAGLTRLRKVQTGQVDASAAIESMQALTENTAVATAVRHDARIWLARRVLQQREDPSEALRWTHPLWTAWQAGALLPDQADIAADTHARALARSGDVDGAQAVEALRAPVRSSRPSEGVPAELRRMRENSVVEAAVGVSSGFLAVASPLAVWSVRRRGWARPWGLLPWGVAVAAVGLLTALWDTSLLPMMGALGAWGAVAHALTAQASGAVEGGARAVVGVLGAAGSLAGGVVVLHHFGAMGSLVG